MTGNYIQSRYLGDPVSREVTVINVHGKQSSHSKLNACRHIINHSPDGFNWGYSGSGPSQLALAILVDALPVVWIAEKLYKKYRDDVISKLDQGCRFEITRKSVMTWYSSHRLAVNSLESDNQENSEENSDDSSGSSTDRDDIRETQG